MKSEAALEAVVNRMEWLAAHEPDRFTVIMALLDTMDGIGSEDLHEIGSAVLSLIAATHPWLLPLGVKVVEQAWRADLKVAV